MLRALLVLCALGLASSKILPEISGCGYDSCTQAKAGLLNVHIVPHTHDDVGWLKTVDQYYYGSRNNIQKAGVQYILDSVIQELTKDPKRRFIYVETAFFWKWWMKQSEDIRDITRELVRQGRLQFVGGAWSMNDEAASHYQSTIDQFTWGLSKLNDTFGPCATPHVGWQIDPFGHSREFASLLAAMGYDGLFLGRIDWEDKKNRLEQKTMEMLWRGDDDLGRSSDIFTGILYNTYSPPPGFCFDVLCSDEPIIDDADSPMFNVDQRISEFLRYVQEQAKHYVTNNIIVTMGGDFTYQDAAMWFGNLDKLIQYTNLKAAQDGLNIKLFYSTPNCYLKAVKDANPQLPTKQDDFFPYSSDPHSFWTGYFTSRPTTKYFEREANGYLQMAKQLQVLTQLEDHNKVVLHELMSAMGIMQHHDAITGTEKQHVTHDYERILDMAIEDANIIAKQAFNKMMQGDALKPPLFSYDRCHLNESSCDTSLNSHQFVITIYNPVGWEVKEPIRVPVSQGNYEVYAPNGDIIASQIVDIPKEVLNIPTRVSKATHELVFIAYLHPVSYKSFYVRAIDKSNAQKSETISLDKSRKRRETKKSTEYYDSINDYWKKVREQPLNEIRSLEEKEIYNVVNKQTTSESSRIPDAPTLKKQCNGCHVNSATDINFDEVLKNARHVKKPGDAVPDVDDLIKSFKEEFEAPKYSTNRKPIPQHLPALSDVEMRMLADDPLLVATTYDDLQLKFGDKILHLGSSGHPTHISLADGTDVKFNIAFWYYTGCIGNNEVAVNRSSGAYIFRPDATAPKLINYNYTQGPSGAVFKELRLSTDKNAAAYIRTYDGLDYLEVEWVVGPIDIEDKIGKEYIIRYSTDLINNGEFYTDSNGRQMVKRKLNTRPQWNVNIQEPVGGNYYPVTNKIFITDDNTRVSVLTDRSEGGTSLEEGQLEVMLHRRLLHDDAFGVGEALNETAFGKGLVAKGKHRIFISNDNKKDNYIKEKKRTIEFHLQPKVFVSDAKDVSLEQWKNLTKAFSWVNEMPEGLHLLTLEPWNNGALLLRLENYLEKSDKDDTTIVVDAENIFKKTIKVVSLKETTLAANQWLDDDIKWVWNTDNVEISGDKNKNVVKRHEGSKIENNNDLNVKLNAKEIRTFVVRYEID